MADRYVRMNILSSGGDDAKKTLDELAERARALGAESPDLKITADDTIAEQKIKDLMLKIEILNRERAEVSIETQGEDDAKAKLLEVDAALRDLSEKVARPDIDVQGMDRAEAKLIRLKALMDDMHNKSISIKVDKGDLSTMERLYNDLLGIRRALFSKVTGLFGGGGSSGENAVEEGAEGGGGDTGSGLLSAIGGANNEYFGGAIAGLIALAASVAPGLIPTALGGGVGIGGAIGAIMLNKQTKALGTSLLSQLEKEFVGSLTSEEGGFLRSGNKVGAGGIAGSSFVSGLDTILKQIGGFVKTLGPGLGEMFRASLPFLSMFVGFMEQLAKLLLPAFTSSMKEMQPYLPTMAQGFAYLAEGIADFIKDLGPGMKDGAIVFKATMDAVKGILIGIAFAADGLAIAFVKLAEFSEWVTHQIASHWDQAFEHIDSGFDATRHYIATVWDNIYDDSIGFALSYITHLSEIFQDFMHDTARTFDDIRHDVASTWDDMFSDLRSDALTKLDQIGNDAKRFWDSISNGFDNLRHSVASVWDAMWSDARSMADAGVRGLTTAVHGIINAFESPVKFVVDNVWDRLAGIWNSIQGIVHVGFKLPVVHMAHGGRIPGYGGGDTVPALLERGEVVVDKDRAAALAPVFRAAGVPGFSTGGIIGGLGSFFSGLGKDLLGWITKPLSFIESHVFGSVTGLLGDLGDTGLGDVLRALIKAVINSLTGSLHQQGASTAPYTGAYGPGVGQWTSDILHVFSMLGLPKSDLGTVLAQMMTESGGNPNAINLTDINAQQGDPSRGLMQVIMTTFEAYRSRSLPNDIYNPLANIYAGLNYAIHRYGNPGWLEVLGHGHGYANGGLIMEPIAGIGLRSGMPYSFGEKGMETVMPGNRTAMGGGDVYVVNFNGVVGDPDAVGLQMQQVLRRFRKHHGNQPLGFD